ncbi:MAG: hypothetical protein ABII90_09935 [Bacteroidota bacterium]
MTDKISNGSFWKLSKGAQISMWVIGMLFMLLIFLGGRESVKYTVNANETSIKIHEVRVTRIEKDVEVLKSDIREELKEIKDTIIDIRKLIMEER